MTTHETLVLLCLCLCMGGNVLAALLMAARKFTAGLVSWTVVILILVLVPLTH